jgi:phosphoglycerol transferase
MHDYEQIKPYIASKDNKLHWSYGIMKGEDAAQYNEILAMLPAEKMIEKLREIGFKGILINKRGYDLEEIKSLTSDFNKYLDKPKIENIEFVYYQIN